MDLLDANDIAGEYPPSWYASVAPVVEPCPELRGEARADVCVVGGGYTGLSAALHLARAGLDVVLLDAQRAGWGASGRNGGQVGSGLNQDQDWLEKAFGMTRARALWDMAEEAKALVRSLIAQNGIDCDLKPGVIHADHKKDHVGPHHAYVEKLARDYGYDQITPLDREAVMGALGTSAYHGGSLDMGAAHLNPLDYALGLARAAARAGVRIYERSRVTGLEPGARVRVRTGGGGVCADFALLACNGYLGGIAPPVAARVMPVNNYIVATEPLGDEMAAALIRDDVAVADSRFVVNYFRLSADRRLLFGGGESYGSRFPKDIAGKVRRRMLGIYPQLASAAVEYAWGGTLAITTNRMPAFQRLGPNVLSAAGYSGHGVAMATLAGKLMAGAVQGAGARFDLLADLPQRGFPGGPSMRAPLLALGMIWYGLRDRL